MFSASTYCFYNSNRNGPFLPRRRRVLCPSYLSGYYYCPIGLFFCFSIFSRRLIHPVSFSVLTHLFSPHSYPEKEPEGKNFQFIADTGLDLRMVLSGLGFELFPGKFLCTEEEFRHFLTDYVEKLNNSYTVTHSPDSLPVAEEIQKGYARLEKEFGLIHPPAHLKAKTMLISPLLSKVGVTGYMGPFFCEFNLNRELRPEEYPGVFAHETAHRLGISSEAEANFYAWLICNRSESAAIRYSGNFILLGYVLQNANRLLSEDEFKQFTTSIRPEIIGQYKAYLKYWRRASEKFKTIFTTCF